MTTLLWFLVIMVGLGMVFTFFAPVILRFLLKWLNKKAAQAMEEQSRTYREKAQNNSPFEENVFFGKEVKVSIPKKYPDKKKKVETDEIQEVDFEDVE